VADGHEAMPFPVRRYPCINSLVMARHGPAVRESAPDMLVGSAERQ